MTWTWLAHKSVMTFRLVYDMRIWWYFPVIRLAHRTQYSLHSLSSQLLWAMLSRNPGFCSHIHNKHYPSILADTLRKTVPSFTLKRSLVCPSGGSFSRFYSRDITSIGSKTELLYKVFNYCKDQKWTIFSKSMQSYHSINTCTWGKMTWLQHQHRHTHDCTQRDG